MKPERCVDDAQDQESKEWKDEGKFDQGGTAFRWSARVHPPQIGTLDPELTGLGV